MTATVMSAGAPMDGANVTFTVTKANGSVVTGNSTTGSNGVATYKVRLNKKDPVGTYQLKAVGSMGTVSGTALTTFVVQFMDYQKIITIEPDKRSGKPCIRRTRMTVTDVLEYLAGA
jgi:uncharacterized protein YfaS (alpha-2-macroglobulin family)